MALDSFIHAAQSEVTIPSVVGRASSFGSDAFISVIKGPPAAVAGDVAAPTATVVSPPPGPIGKDQQIVLDVVDVGGGQVTLVLLLARLGGGDIETVHDGSSFTEDYSSSTRNAIPNGYRYTITRTGGWTASPTFHVRAVDNAGNVL